MKYRSLLVCLEVAACAWLGSLIPVHAQGTAFTYQGSLLSNGTPVTGSYDLQFSAQTAPSGSTQTGPLLTNAPVAVSNGVFTTTLDFGNVFAVSPIYLEVGVRTNGSTNAYVILSPRQLLTSTPYAVQALVAANLTGGISASQLPADVAFTDSNRVFTAAVTFSNATGNFSGNFNGNATGTFSGNATGSFTGTNNGKFIGDGSSISNLNVTNITGVIQSNPNWQLVSSTSVTGVAGNNYLATNNSLTTLTLPASPGVGSTLWLAGSGANGWKVAQTGSQTILTSTLGLPAGQNWVVANSTSSAWHAVACSGNGDQAIAAVGTGFIFYSTNSGNTWTQSDAPSENWQSLASSTDGTHMVAAPNNSAAYLFTSVNGGAHWTQRSNGLNSSLLIHSVASSASGLSLVAATDSGLGPIFTSADGGNNWTNRVSGQNWAGVASSSDGTRLAAISGSGVAYVSVNSGVTWSSNVVTAFTCTGIASSGDGSVLAVSSDVGPIYVSSDGGNSWVSRATSQAWTCVTAAANGQSLAAAYSVGFIYTSVDRGQTWQARTNGVLSTSMAWSCIGTSADGTQLFGGVATGSVFGSTAATTSGTNGSLIGTQYSNVQLQYIGNNQWMPLTFIGSFIGN